MTLYCLAPLVLIGYLGAIQTNHGHVSHESGTSLEVQTCEDGLGAHARAVTSGLYAVGAQYGFSTTGPGQTKWTIQPRAGLSYADHPVDVLPLRTQFELGLQGLVGIGDFRIGIEYLHFSNAGLRSPNAGLDMIGVMTGVVF